MNKAFMKNTTGFIAAILLFQVNASTHVVSQESKQKTVVFVCEHGVAKSIVAAAHFNKLAQERNLPFHAVARSTAPQDSLLQSVAEGLRGDKLPPPTQVAPKLTQKDGDKAVRSIFFCPVPTSFAGRSSVREWQNIPPVSQQYQASRDSMITRIRALLDELSGK